MSKAHEPRLVWIMLIRFASIRRDRSIDAPRATGARPRPGRCRASPPAGRVREPRTSRQITAIEREIMTASTVGALRSAGGFLLVAPLRSALRGQRRRRLVLGTNAEDPRQLAA